MHNPKGHTDIHVPGQTCVYPDCLPHGTSGFEIESPIYINLIYTLQCEMAIFVVVVGLHNKVCKTAYWSCDQNHFDIFLFPSIPECSI